MDINLDVSLPEAEQVMPYYTESEANHLLSYYGPLLNGLALKGTQHGYTSLVFCKTPMKEGMFDIQILLMGDPLQIPRPLSEVVEQFDVPSIDEILARIRLLRTDRANSKGPF